MPAKHIAATQQVAGLCLPSRHMPTIQTCISPSGAVTCFAIFSNLKDLVWDAFKHSHDTQLLLQWQIDLAGLLQEPALRKQAACWKPTRGESKETQALGIKAWDSEPEHLCGSVTLACWFFLKYAFVLTHNPSVRRDYLGTVYKVFHTMATEYL